MIYHYYPLLAIENCDIYIYDYKVSFPHLSKLSQMLHQEIWGDSFSCPTFATNHTTLKEQNDSSYEINVQLVLKASEYLKMPKTN